MKKLAILSFFLLTGILQTNAQYTCKGMKPTDVSKGKANAVNYPLEKFAGKWQEVKRTDLNNKDQAFTDTIYLQIVNNKAVFTQGKA